jgi:hypothetical protein
MGQNSGRITAITEASITLVDPVHPVTHLRIAPVTYHAVELLHPDTNETKSLRDLPL